MPRSVLPSRTATVAGRSSALWLLPIVAATLVVYWPALRGAVLWDDAGHITRTDLRPLSGLARIWFQVGATQQYYPMLHTAFWFEHRLWGDATLGYHLANVLQHSLAAFLFGLLLRRLAVSGAWLAAGLFALHPVCVESVAWISEQKNTLSAVFYLLSALAYLRFDEHRRKADYAIASGWFACALLTKTVTATLPAALLVLGWWRRGRLDWRRDVLPLLPWLAAGVATGLFTAHFERALIGAQGADFSLDPLSRGLLAGRVFWFYLAKLAWPADLIFIYPRWSIDPAALWPWLFPLAALALLGCLLYWSRRARAPLATALLFGGTLFPALGFFDVFPFLFSYVADHFQYLASLSVFALGAAALWQWTGRLPAGWRYLAIAIPLATLGALSRSQCGMYRDVTTLYRTTIERNPACWLACYNLAIVYTESKQLAEAIPLLEKTLQLRPDYVPAAATLGDNLRRLGRPQEAIPHLERAVRLEPLNDRSHVALGIALREIGRAPESLPEFATALRLRPDNAVAERNLGLVLTWLDRASEAIPHLERAVQLRPDYAEAELDWGIALTLASGLSVGQPHFERALALDPLNPEFPYTYARALLHAGRVKEAATQLQSVVRLSSDNAKAHLDLSRVLRRLGRLSEADRHQQIATQLNASLANQRP